jgi:fatty acid synthase subunit beta
VDIFGWFSLLGDPESWPEATYLASAPVSFPMICLTQLMHYYVTMKYWQLTPAQITTYYKGITGHSQGMQFERMSLGLFVYFYYFIFILFIFCFILF